MQMRTPSLWFALSMGKKLDSSCLSFFNYHFRGGTWLKRMSSFVKVSNLGTAVNIVLFQKIFKFGKTTQITFSSVRALRDICRFPFGEFRLPSKKQIPTGCLAELGGGRGSTVAHKRQTELLLHWKKLLLHWKSCPTISYIRLFTKTMCRNVSKRISKFDSQVVKLAPPSHDKEWR